MGARCLVGLAVVAGCGGGAPAPAEPAPPLPAPTRELAVAEPAPPPRPLPPPSSPGQRPIILRSPLSLRDEVIVPVRGARAEPIAEARSDRWDPCVRDLLANLPRPQRDALGDALTLATTTCDRSAQRATFSPPQRRAYAASSHLGFAGEITPRSVRLELVIVRRGGPPPERITLLAGRTRWTSPKLDVTVEGDTATAALPYTRSVARALQAVLDAPDAIVRFESESGADDIVLADDIRADLRVFADL